MKNPILQIADQPFLAQTMFIAQQAIVIITKFCIYFLIPFAIVSSFAADPALEPK
jgi:hypothetical protein